MDLTHKVHFGYQVVPRVRTHCLPCILGVMSRVFACCYYVPSIQVQTGVLACYTLWPQVVPRQSARGLHFVHI